MDGNQARTHQPRRRITANGVRLTLLVAIATLGVLLGAPAVMATAARNGMPDTERQLILVAIIELMVAAGTLTYFSTTRPTYERIIGALLVFGALSVTVTAGVSMYGALGFIAPVAYLVSAHLTAAPRQPKKVTPNAAAEAWVGGHEDVAPHETVDVDRILSEIPGDAPGDDPWVGANLENSIPPDMAAIESRRADPVTEQFTAPQPADEDEIVTRLRALRAEHGWQSAAKERDALQVGWPRIRAARTTLETEQQ